MCCENSFGRAFNTAFRDSTSGRTLDEEGLFGALEDSLCALSYRFNIAVFHGNSHQLTYESTYTNPTPGHPPARARCELCDLLIVVRSSHEVRLTCFQAKRETRINAVRDRVFNVNPYPRTRTRAKGRQSVFREKSAGKTGAAQFAPLELNFGQQKNKHKLQ